MVPSNLLENDGVVIEKTKDLINSETQQQIIDQDTEGLFLSDLIESRDTFIPIDEKQPDLKHYVEGQGDMNWLIGEYIEQHQLSSFEAQHVSFIFIEKKNI